jgi:ABC-type amino acid transport substrate-binding protein
MHTRKLLLVLIIVGVWAGNTCVAAPIKMGYFLLPPHQYLNEDEDAAQPHGAAIAYFEIAASIMEEKVEWVGPLPLLRLAEYLKTGQLDGAVGFNRSPKSEAYLYYTASPVYLAQPILLVRQDNPITEIQSIDDIQGYRIGLIVTSGGLYTPLLDTHREAISLEGLGGNKWAEQNIQKLLGGRLDAVFDRQPYTLPFVAARMQRYAQVKVLPIPDPPMPMYVVFSKASQQGQALLDQYNAILPELAVDYAELAQQELDAAIAQE